MADKPYQYIGPNGGLVKLAVESDQNLRNTFGNDPTCPIIIPNKFYKDRLIKPIKDRDGASRHLMALGILEARKADGFTRE